MGGGSLSLIQKAVERGNLDKPALLEKHEHLLRKFYEEDLEAEYQEYVAAGGVSDE